MTKGQIINPVTGERIEVTVTEIIKEENEPIMLKLEDGAVLRFKVDIAQVSRLPNPQNVHSEPLYHVKSNNAVTLLTPPNDY